MGFWSWLTKKADQPSEKSHQGDNKDYFELVFLMDKTLHCGIEFVQGAIEHAFEVTFSDDPNSSDFVTGEWPIFLFKLRGEMFEIKFLAFSYYDERAPRVVAGDRGMLLAKGPRDEMQRALHEHQGMITVRIISPSKSVSRSEAYARVGNMLAAFSCPEVRAVLWTFGNRVRLWEDEMEEILNGGEPLALFD